VNERGIENSIFCLTVPVVRPTTAMYSSASGICSTVTSESTKNATFPKNSSAYSRPFVSAALWQLCRLMNLDFRMSDADYAPDIFGDDHW
jgi:hypothetical protein